MPRHRTGCAVARKVKKNGKTTRAWFARIEYVNESGKRLRVERKPEFNTKTSAREMARKMLSKVDGDGSAFDSFTMTFAQLADYYRQTYLVGPEYRDGRKIAGLRSSYDLEKRLKVLRDYFGARKLRSITHGDLQHYKAHRLKTPVVVGRNTRGTEKEGRPRERERSIATVNRELSFMRRILNVACSHGWIPRNPFEQGEPLIRPGDEKPRERILTREEEERLLSCCVNEREHLRPIIICALDTGMRRSEMFTLAWHDVDFEAGLITIRAFNTKTMRERQVAMTERLKAALAPLARHARPQDLVFGIKTNVKTAFNNAKKNAGLPDLRFHDLRHTHATRLVAAQMPLPEVGRVLGHTQPSTTYRYVNANVDTARRAADLLNQFNGPVKKSRKASPRV